jgi:uncharacterized protein (TIGR03086 family)
MNDVIDNYRGACSGFSAIVAQGEGRWTNPSPCSEWDARGVVEHVIGFHDELLLRPTGTTPTRPKDDPEARWVLTVTAIDLAVDIASSTDGRERPTPDEINLDQLLPALTSELLAHTWDLAQAIGVDPHLDPDLCELSLGFMQANEEQVRSSGLFGAPVSRPSDTDAATRLITFLGRDPGWNR